MTQIRIKFSFDELRRRAAAVLGVDVRDIESVLSMYGGRAFYVTCYRDYRYDHARYSSRPPGTRVATITIWQLVDALPLEDISGGIENLWDRSLQVILEILNLERMPKSEAEIKKAYRALAKIHHPDVGGDEENFREITLAYESLILKLPELQS